MFDKTIYISRGVNLLPKNLISTCLQLLEVARSMTELDYLQVFVVSSVKDPNSDNVMLHIKHFQEQPPYSYEVSIDCTQNVNEKLYMIDDGMHSTLLLASEY
ncbi:DUF960 family protein [Mycoplasmatota bacterium WC44]